MSLPEDLLPASYRGVTFLFKSGTTTGSKKLVKKTFPNSKKQSIENLGGIPKTFNMVAVLTGDDYLQRRNSLITALDNDDFGTLIHPFYGTIENVIAARYDVPEEISSLADAKISIVFEVRDSVGIPVASGNSLSVLSRQGNTVIDSITESFTDQFGVSGAFPNNFTAAADKINDLVEAFRDNTSFLSVATEQIDSFSLQLGELSNNVTQLISDPVELSISINSLFETLNGLYATPEATYQSLKRFFDFGDDDIEVPKNTASREERVENAAVFNQYIQAQALTYSFLNVSEFDFTLREELTDTSVELEEEYQKIINNTEVNDGDPEIGLSSDAKSSITDLRILVQDFFNEQSLATEEIVQINTPRLPARIIAYQYYADSSQGEKIAQLNDSLGDPTFLEGDINIVSV